MGNPDHRPVPLIHTLIHKVDGARMITARRVHPNPRPGPIPTNIRVEDPTAPISLPSVRKPSVHTDAFENDELDHKNKMVFLGGGIAYWWGERFGSPEHQDYVQWRHDVRATLIEHNFLVYAPHEAFKGTWNRKAQIVNDAAITVSDLVLVISASYAIGNGTREETEFARRSDVPVAHAPPETGLMKMLETVRINVK